MKLYNYNDIVTMQTFMQPAKKLNVIDKQAVNDMAEFLKTGLETGKELIKDKLITVAESAEILSCSKQTIFRMISENKLTRINITGSAKSLRLKESEVRQKGGV